MGCGSWGGEVVLLVKVRNERGVTLVSGWSLVAVSCFLLLLLVVVGV